MTWIRNPFFKPSGVVPPPPPPPPQLQTPSTSSSSTPVSTTPSNPDDDTESIDGSSDGRQLRPPTTHVEDEEHALEGVAGLLQRPTDRMTGYQFFYIFILDGIGAMILSGGIGFVIAYGMFVFFFTLSHPLSLYPFLFNPFIYLYKSICILCLSSPILPFSPCCVEHGGQILMQTTTTPPFICLFIPFIPTVEALYCYVM